VVDEDQGVTLTARWGEQLDVRHITEAGDDDKELSAEQVAGYVAKYATKSTEALGVTLDHRIGEVELEGLDVPAHVAELVRACLEAGRLAVAGEAAAAELGACLASAATSRPRAGVTPPPWVRCGGPGSPTPSAGAEAIPFRSMPGRLPRTTRP
jgi:replication initiator protein RepSA